MLPKPDFIPSPKNVEKDSNIMKTIISPSNSSKLALYATVRIKAGKSSNIPKIIQILISMPAWNPIPFGRRQINKV